MRRKNEYFFVYIMSQQSKATNSSDQTSRINQVQANQAQDQTDTDDFSDAQMTRDFIAAIPLAENIPIIDVLNIIKITDPDIYSDYHEFKLPPERSKVLSKTIKDLKTKLAFNRISNRVCNQCVNKNFPKAQLICCEKCRLTFWCSEKCKKDNTAEHAKWCMRDVDAVETGPMRVVLLETKPVEGKKPPPKK